MGLNLKGGKTPPRLLSDLRLYNPQCPPTNQYNVLTDILLYDEKVPDQKRIHKRACRHTWALKPNQCTIDPTATISKQGNAQAAAYCPECRSHLLVELDCTKVDATSRPCPQKEAPLHHFVYMQHESSMFKLKDQERSDTWEDCRVFRCSLGACNTKLTVKVNSPRLRNEWVELLVNRNLIDQRAEAAKASDPVRFQGHANPPVSDVLSHLRQYIQNSMKGDVRKINSTNKKWMLSLGDPCSELLQYLGFSRHEDEWLPPRPEASAAVPFQNELKILLDDVDKELIALYEKKCEPDRRGPKPYPPQVSAFRDFQRTLGCIDYATNPGSRIQDFEIDEHPFYASLGTVLDFHDDLISFAYDRQVFQDSQNTPYYLECLQGIATGRSSERLLEKAAIEASLGRLSMRDVRDAYRELNLSIDDQINDETIIGIFQSRIVDAGKSHQAIMKRALTVIGQHRQSERLQWHASDTITNYDQALSWLGASADMDESFIVNMYGVKLNENPANKDLARKCVELIAENRNSSTLKMWLSTGDLTESEMDPAQAYARLGIEARSLDDETVLAAYSAAKNDAPSQQSEFDRALLAIAKDKGSDMLMSFLQSSGSVPGLEHALDQWPVGLDNIGNTCYLNSILQYYFAIREVRQIVLNIDRYKMPVENQDWTQKRVGSRPVSREEVIRAQLFTDELRSLFTNMITANKKQIAPTRQLARLTIKQASEKLSSDPTSAGSGKIEPSSEGNTGAEELTKKQSKQAVEDTESTSAQDDASSEGTLVDASHTSGDHDYMLLDANETSVQAQAFEDKENLAPTKITVAAERASTPENVLQPLAESSPSRVNEQSIITSLRSEAEKRVANKNNEHDATVAAGPPNRPPPIPPRDDEKALAEAEESARQQDVTEVIGNVLFQLQCAIRPLGFDVDNEQIDEIKQLFYGKTLQTTTDSQGSARTKEEYFSDIKINFHGGIQDIYEAIATSFDRQWVDVKKEASTDGGGQDLYEKQEQYTTISTLPPILQIYPNRTGWRSNGGFKINDHLAFDDKIYMDTFIESNDSMSIKRRQQRWAWQNELRELESQIDKLKTTPMPGISTSIMLDLVAKKLKDLSDEDEEDVGSAPRTAEAVQQVSNDIQTDLKSLQERAATLRQLIRQQFVTGASVEYRLHAVFIHRGQFNSGHYWIYIFDFQQNIWRSYNDGYVKKVNDPVKEIFAPSEDKNRPATATFLAYVKADMVKEVTEAVCRDPTADASLKEADVGTNDSMQGIENASSSQWKSFQHWAGESPGDTQKDPQQKSMLEITDGTPTETGDGETVPAVRSTKDFITNRMEAHQARSRTNDTEASSLLENRQPSPES